MIIGRVSLVIAALTFASLAHADPSAEDAAAATKLFQEGRALVDAGTIDAACVKFEASWKLDPQLGTKLNLGDCRKRQGKLAAALVTFHEAEAQAVREGKIGRADYVRQQIRALEALVARVSLRIAEPDIAGLSIQLTTSAGTRELPRSTWSAEQLAEAGTITVTSSAPGRRTASIKRDVAGGIKLVIDVAPLALAPPSASEGRAPLTTQRSRSVAPLIVGGGGVVLLIGAGVLGYTAKQNYDKATNDAGVTDAQHRADVASVVAAAGVVAVGVGIVLYFRDRDERVVVAPTTDGAGAGLAVAGSF